MFDVFNKHVRSHLPETMHPDYRMKINVLTKKCGAGEGWRRSVGPIM
jgi:hypothetical protein